jgi:hypothetical protein
MVDKDVTKLTLEEVDCLSACKNWLGAFVESSDKLVADLRFVVIGEYRRNVKQGGRAYLWLNQLETKPRDRKLVELEIDFDDEGYAKVPSHCEIPDKDDRKWVALALAHNPTPPIVNATDTDWAQTKTILDAAELTVMEFCPAYIKKKLAEQ